MHFPLNLARTVETFDALNVEKSLFLSRPEKGLS